ncbi:protein phosphatase 4, regulatory subunit 2 [Blyttiomyces sp. JEL0837]|nr:protein phosphatase 4, regulatory subunit 2 [Blyttiomyces sp. JEL0837]
MTKALVGVGDISDLERMLDSFDSPPFTVQRLCELVQRPTEHHKTAEKLKRAIEKVLLVTSTEYENSDVTNSEQQDMAIEPKSEGETSEAKTEGHRDPMDQD